MEMGVFLGWRKQDGEHVSEGEILYELEGEKAAQEIEAIEFGILRIPPGAPAVGAEVPVGTLLGYLTCPDEPPPWMVATSGESAGRQRTDALAPDVASDTRAAHHASPSARRRARELGVPIDSVCGSGRRGRVTRQDLESHARTARTPAGTASASSPSTAISRETPPAGGECRRCTPRARRVARELGIDWAGVQGSGRGGRIRERDVRQAAQEQSSALPRQRRRAAATVPLTRLRRVIAQRMLASSQTTAPVTLTTQVDARNLVNLRDQFKSAGDAVVPTFNDIIIKLVGDLLAQDGQLAARCEEDKLVIPGSDEIHIGLAVETADGLFVPVIRQVPQASLLQVSQLAAELVARARAGTLGLDQLQGAVFTITNLGAYGIDAFTPIINVPESAILGIGAIRREPVVQDDDQIVVGVRLTLSLTFDHRVIDGAPAARFLAAVREAIENPVPRLLGCGRI
jgi:pyruvate dehydrogenase E2 component (dihydrolipoamide acetyltransferase)